MNQENNKQNSQKRKVGEKYLDQDGKEQTRGSSEDFQTLPYRHINAIMKLEGLKEDEELMKDVEYASHYYDMCNYTTAQGFLTRVLNKSKTLEPYLFYYLRVCEHVLSIPLTNGDMYYEKKFTKYLALPKWLRWTMFGFKILDRCKWCGRYIRYTSPDEPTFGFDTYKNGCKYCGRMYPMPSWMWDSPDGRAYSYYRMSFSGDEFYEEFEKDYDAQPLCKHRRKPN